MNSYLFYMTVAIIFVGGITTAHSQSNNKTHKDSWALSVGLGMWISNGQSGNNLEEDAVILPAQMNNVSLALNWNFAKRFQTNLTVSLQIDKNIPPNPNPIAFLDGDDISLEGSGGGFTTLSAGIKYYFMPERFKPYLQLSSGIVIGRSQYTFVEGNINDGLNRTDISRESRAIQGIISTGFDFQFEEIFNLNLNVGYGKSTHFDQQIGGFDRFNGFQISTSFGLIL